MGVRSDLRLFRTAVLRGYPVTPELRQQMMDTVASILSDPLAKDREKIAAGKLLISADMANEKINQNGLSTELILLFAEQNGIKDDVLKLINEGEGGAFSVPDTVIECERNNG